MIRTQIPTALLKARRADIDKIPDRVLRTLTRADLANRLLAAGEFRKRASVPHLDADLYSYRLGLAREVLETEDPKRAAELVKEAGTGVTPAARIRAAVRPSRRPVPAPGPAQRRNAMRLLDEAAGGVAKAAGYEAKAAAVSSPEDRSAYLELAADERRKAGTR